MYRKPIRSSDSEKSVKPRACDVLVDEKGEVSLVMKTAKQRVIIQLCDLLRQVKEAKEEAAKMQGEQQ